MSDAICCSEELWLPVVGYEGSYEVSSCGRVRSLDRHVPYSGGKPRFNRGRLRKFWMHDGYYKVTLGSGGKLKSFYVHYLVCAAFHGPRPSPKHEVRHHRVAVRTNCHAANLCWGTRIDNARDKVAHGNHPNARKTDCSAGHKFDETNTRVTPHGRICRKCSHARDKEYRTKDAAHKRERSRLRQQKTRDRRKAARV